MARGGAHKADAEPERRCLVTGESGPKSGLIRFVTGPDATVAPDIFGKLPGRGYYVSSTRTALTEAVKKNLFAKGARQKVDVTPELIATVEDQLVKRVTSLIAMARKAGLAVAGFEKVKARLAEERVRVLFQASDGSERGKSKLWTPQGARYFGCLTATELGLAFGRGHVIHGALSAGGLSTRVVEDATKLRGLREDATAQKDDRA